MACTCTDCSRPPLWLRTVGGSAFFIFCASHKSARRLRRSGTGSCIFMGPTTQRNHPPTEPYLGTRHTHRPVLEPACTLSIHPFPLPADNPPEPTGGRSTRAPQLAHLTPTQPHCHSNDLPGTGQLPRSYDTPGQHAARPTASVVHSRRRPRARQPAKRPVGARHLHLCAPGATCRSRQCCTTGAPPGASTEAPRRHPHGTLPGRKVTATHTRTSRPGHLKSHWAGPTPIASQPAAPCRRADHPKASRRLGPGLAVSRAFI